ncbi:MAG: T3SS effector HopA1 family protein [Cytophagales bacterium]|nr:T3SS effector HopA1 family protein [Cytophagales bacterium]
MQAKFKAAYSDKSLIAKPMPPTSSPPLRISPFSSFLHDIHHGFSSGEQIIGLPEGLFLVSGPLKSKSAVNSFEGMIEWLYEVWERFRDLAMTDERSRLNLEEMLYYHATNKTSHCTMSAQEYLRILGAMLENRPDYLKCCWQGYDFNVGKASEEGEEEIFQFFPARSFLKFTTVDIVKDGTFLFFENSKKTKGSYSGSVYRLYINTVPDFAPELLQFFLERVILNEEFPHTFFIKISDYNELPKRLDNILLYSNSMVEMKAIMKVLQAHFEELSHCFETDVPPMVKKLHRGIGYSHTPLFAYKPFTETISFDYSRPLLDELLQHVALAEDPSIKAFAQSPDNTAILDRMKDITGHSLLPETRSWAVSMEDMDRLSENYSRYTGKNFTPLNRLIDSTTFTRKGGIFEPSDSFSFLELRSQMIAQALLDSLFITRDPNVFICKVWKYFDLAQINFFEPHKNLPSF